MAGEDELERSEMEAVLETRRELGSTYDAALVESFADRIEAAVAARAAHDLDRRGRTDRDRAAAGPRQLALGIVSVVAGIPITAITLAVPESGELSLLSLVVSMGGIVSVNVAHALQSRPSGRRDDGR